MENRKGSGIFLGVIGVATLIVAIIGATFAYFSANAASAENAVTATSAVLKLGYDDIKDGLKTNLIPAEDYIALYGATNTTHIEEKGQCIDDYGNEICGVYTFTVGNPSFTTTQNLYGSIVIQSNEFTDLWFRIQDEDGNDVVEPMNFADETRNVDGVITLSELNQTLIASPASDAEKDGYNAEKPSTYTLTTGTINGETAYNRRTYTMIIWIEETKTDQTELNSGKTFAAGINFVTGQGETGVTGLIQAAQDAYDAEQNQTEENTGA